MALITELADVSAQIQKFWAPTLRSELKEDTLLPSLVSKEFQGSIMKGGDTVKVSTIQRPTAVRKTIGVAGYNDYQTDQLQTGQVEVVADTIIQAGYEIESLIDLQTQIHDPNSQIRQGLFEAIEIELNNYLYEQMAPTSSTSGVTTFDASQLGAAKIYASQQKWAAKNKYLLLDPVYHQDLMNVTSLTSKDFVMDCPVVGGQIATQRFGFNILEDNSAGMSALSPTTATSQLACAFDPDFIHFVMQQGMEIKVSDLHSNKKRGFILTADIIVGSKLAYEGAVSHMEFYNV